MKGIDILYEENENVVYGLGFFKMFWQVIKYGQEWVGCLALATNCTEAGNGPQQKVEKGKVYCELIFCLIYFRWVEMGRPALQCKPVKTQQQIVHLTIIHETKSSSKMFKGFVFPWNIKFYWRLTWSNSVIIAGKIFHLLHSFCFR